LAALYRADDQSVMSSRCEKNVEEPVETQGERRWIETYKKPVIAEDGTLFGKVGFARVFTYRRIAEESLGDRTEQLDAIFSLSPDGFITFGTDRKIKFVNPAFQLMTGINASELIGLDEPKFLEKLFEHCKATLPLPAKLDGEQPKRMRRLSIELLAPKRRVLEVDIRTSQSSTVSQILYFRDITYESEVDHMKSEFMSTAAHELRTPMASILGFSELLMSRDFDATTRKDLLETIHKQSELMVSILNELLDLARIEARGDKDFILERLSLIELLEDAALSYSPPQGRTAPVIQKSSEPTFIRADRKKLLQVIRNILSNAYKYSPAGGEVLINVFTETTDQGSQTACFSIKDQGIGMSKNQLARVCERFYRADTSGNIPGTGLGMSIVEEIIQLHKGSMEITSQLGMGTQVVICMPALLD
jgi:signal transduction histidine kinase